MCDCKSYNSEVGSIPEVILPRPGWLPDGVRVNGVPVDACIATTVAKLWERGILTASSCCGHNGLLGNPSLVLGENVDPVEAAKVLMEIDSRQWDLKQWQLVTLGGTTVTNSDKLP